MSEEQKQEAAPTANNDELLKQVKALESRVQSMDAKNKELLDEKKKYQKLEQTLQSMPDGTDVQKLLEFNNYIKSWCDDERGQDGFGDRRREH